MQFYTGNLTKFFDSLQFWFKLYIKSENVKLNPTRCMLFLGNYPASVVDRPTFRNTLFNLHRQVDVSKMN